MTVASFVNVCRFTPTAGGTTDWTFSAAVTGYQSPTSAGATNGATYHVRAESADLSQWELSEGTYNSGTGVFARTTVLYNSSATGTGAGQSGAGTKINFSTVPQVAVVTIKEDLPLLTAAVQADQETGTSTVVTTTPGTQKFHPAHPKAWAQVTQAAGAYTLVATFGVSAINKVATGRVDITLTTAFSVAANYAAIASANEGGPFVCSEITASRTTTNYRILLRNANTNVDADFGFAISFYGDQ